MRGEAERKSERDLEWELEQELELELEREQVERGGEYREHVAVSPREPQATRWTRGGSRARSAG